MRRAVLTVAIAVLGGCATQREPTWDAGSAAQAWTGRTRAELERVWGRPSRTASDGGTGTVLEYDRIETSLVGAGGLPLVAGDETMEKPQVMEESVQTTRVATFWLDAGDRIVRAAIDVAQIPKKARDRLLRPPP